MKALVILSGGQDSATCLYYAMTQFHKVEAITFKYGQMHRVEIDCALALAAKNNIHINVVDISFFATLVESALTSNGDVNKIVNGLPASFVPNRNQLFITIAHAYAQKIDAGILVAGVCQTDYSGYPDCRQEFINHMQYTSNLGSNANIKILTPLMYRDKAATFQLASELGCLNDIINLTHTCYNGIRKELHEWGYGCGECPACLLRKKGYEQFKEKQK